MQFTRKVRPEGNSIIVSIPKELIKVYKVNEYDFVTFEIIKVHRK